MAIRSADGSARSVRAIAELTGAHLFGELMRLLAAQSSIFQNMGR
jgi:hypothetical protein